MLIPVGAKIRCRDWIIEIKLGVNWIRVRCMPERSSVVIYGTVELKHWRAAAVQNSLVTRHRNRTKREGRIIGTNVG